ncbi:MAG: DNA repair protein RecN [Lachnospiraceae bacterium]|nr:DNA repair protein RecN [Lachnospiraceae bacterium]
MLDSISVKNLALIRQAEIELCEGLNILTGETGAGKSILIGSVNLCLGAKADKAMIREGAEYALVELVFHVDNEKTLKAIKEMELPVEEDGTVIISRKVGINRSSIKVCGESVTAKQVRELAQLLIDIHGQHEHQSLLDPKRHRELLDEYCIDDISKELAATAAGYEEYKKLVNRLKALDMDEATRRRETELAEYEINEIEEAALRPGEEEKLEEEFRRIKGVRDSYQGLSRVRELLDEEYGGVLDGLGRAVHELNAAASVNDTMNEDARALSTAEDTLRDVLRDIRDILEDGAFDPEHFDEVENRLDTIRRISARYGGSEADALDYLDKRREELKELNDLDESRKRLTALKAECEKSLGQLCKKLHDKRVKAAGVLKKEISDVLKDLNFLKVDFEVEVRRNDEYSSRGYDDVEFMISLNPGESIRPLKDVASGGELSRIMLALKTVFAAKDDIETLIFDEIDNGISGKTAWKVSEKMGVLSLDRQLICITHLPQIAAMADKHFMIEKEEVGGKTETMIRMLDKDSEEMELARMLGGDEISDAVLSNARELKERAKACKKTAGDGA